MRLFKRFFLFAAELVFLYFGFMFSMGLAVYPGSLGYKFAPVAFLLGFYAVCTALVWFRRKTGKWTIAADAWLAHRSWRLLHPCRARYLQILRCSFLWFPSICSALVLFFLPVASHILYSGTGLVPHYRCSTSLNWLIIKSHGDVAVWTFFSNQGAARYGFTPIWFNHSMPSSAIFFTSDPASSDGWRRPESELAAGHTTHLAVRPFQLGMITATCCEYRNTYNNAGGPSPGILSPPVLWESLCSTKLNGVAYNLRTAFLGQREDLPAFYDLLNSATPAN